ncbi:hypothetical protein N7499_006315 [Penicillium canescens]|nr:hypothetical protein N7499_006315 [Penicillium canescens]KAJ6176762.1 hypothetical protein N7485_003676 [Penicillium canescens]
MNEESDGRRKLSYKRRIASLEQDRALLMRLMESLRINDQSEVDRIVRAIRNGASLAEMDSVLTAGSGLCKPPRTSEIQNVGNLDSGEADNGTSDARQTYLDLNQLSL